MTATKNQNLPRRTRRARSSKTQTFETFVAFVSFVVREYFVISKCRQKINTV